MTLRSRNGHREEREVCAPRVTKTAWMSAFGGDQARRADAPPKSRCRSRGEAGRPEDTRSWLRLPCPIPSACPCASSRAHCPLCPCSVLCGVLVGVGSVAAAAAVGLVASHSTTHAHTQNRGGQRDGTSVGGTVCTGLRAPHCAQGTVCNGPGALEADLLSAPLSALLSAANPLDSCVATTRVCHTRDTRGVNRLGFPVPLLLAPPRSPRLSGTRRRSLQHPLPRSHPAMRAHLRSAATVALAAVSHIRSAA
jgi:hypothetical protein